MPGTLHHRRRKRATRGRKGVLGLILVIVTASFLGGCGLFTPSTSNSTLTLRLEEGVAWKRGYQHSTQFSQGHALDLNWNETVWAGADQPAALRIGEDDQLWLDPGSGFRLVQPVPPDQRPVLRLLEGRLRYRAASNGCTLGTRFPVPEEARIRVTDVVVAPVATGTRLEILIEDLVVNVSVQEGELFAEGNGVSGTLFADWRAIVRPGEPMEIIPPHAPDKPTPTFTSTPTGTAAPTLTSTPTSTPTPTFTSAPTSTPMPTFTSTPTSTPAPTFTSTPTDTPTPSATSTATPSPTFQPGPTATNTPIPTQPPPPTQAPPTQPPAPTQAPPTQLPPPTQAPPTQPPPTQAPPTQPPPTPEPTARPTLGPG